MKDHYWAFEVSENGKPYVPTLLKTRKDAEEARRDWLEVFRGDRTLHAGPVVKLRVEIIK